MFKFIKNLVEKQNPHLQTQRNHARRQDILSGNIAPSENWIKSRIGGLENRFVHHMNQSYWVNGDRFAATFANAAFDNRRSLAFRHSGQKGTLGQIQVISQEELQLHKPHPNTYWDVMRDEEIAQGFKKPYHTLAQLNQPNGVFGDFNHFDVDILLFQEKISKGLPPRYPTDKTWADQRWSYVIAFGVLSRRYLEIMNKVKDDTNARIELVEQYRAEVDKLNSGYNFLTPERRQDFERFISRTLAAPNVEPTVFKTMND